MVKIDVENVFDKVRGGRIHDSWDSLVRIWLGANKSEIVVGIIRES